MRGTIWLFALVCLAPWSIAQENGKIDLPPKPEGGIFANNTYKNDYFGLSYPLTTEWTQGSPAGQSTPPPPGIYFLFTGDRHMGRPLVNRVVLTADDARSYTMSIEQYVSKLVHAQVKIKNGEMVREVHAVDFAGVHFLRADHKEDFSGGSLYNSCLCTQHIGYFLCWNFVAQSQPELEEIVGTLQQLSFRPDGARTQNRAAENRVSGGLMPAAEFPPLRIRVSAAVAEGLLKQQVRPVYPAEAKEKHVQGHVVMKAIIDTNGEVTRLDLVSGHPLLAQAAIEAVRNWKYKPFLLEGKTVEVETVVDIAFQLSGM